MIHSIVGSDGFPFWIPDAPNLVTAAIGPGTWWEPELLPLFDRACQPDRWTVEVGAYLGDHTIALATRGPVLAIEPQTLAWALLGINLALRPALHAWYTVRGGLYSHPVELQLVPAWGEPNHPSSAYRAIELIEQTGQGLLAIPYDALPFHPPCVGFLKIDAQGCDLHVLRGAEQMIARDRPIICCEYYKDLAELHGDTANDYIGWFKVHQYSVYPYSGDNLLGVPIEIDARPFLETRR